MSSVALANDSARATKCRKRCITTIKYDSTCLNIEPGGLPLSLACEICAPKLDPLTKKSSRRKVKERHKHPSNRCKQYWLSRWGRDSKTAEKGKILKHNTVRSYLKIDRDVLIEYHPLKYIPQDQDSPDDSQIIKDNNIEEAVVDPPRNDEVSRNDEVLIQVDTSEVEN